MGQPNDVLNYYLQRNDRIAAICNYCAGKVLFAPEKIRPLDGFYSTRNMKNKMTHIQWDILRQAEVNGKSLLIGIENQNNINLIFPFRQMEMDCLEIRRQIEELQEKNKNEPGADVIDVCVGIRALKEVIRFRRKKKEKECNMCQAIDDLVRISTNEGVVKGKSEDVIQLLEQHGKVPEETVNKIISENNMEQLKHWLFLAASVKSVEEFCADLFLENFININNCCKKC